jgi:hypothetical protein
MSEEESKAHSIVSEVGRLQLAYTEDLVNSLSKEPLISLLKKNTSPNFAKDKEREKQRLLVIDEILNSNKAKGWIKSIAKYYGLTYIKGFSRHANKTEQDLAIFRLDRDFTLGTGSLLNLFKNLGFGIVIERVRWDEASGLACSMGDDELIEVDYMLMPVGIKTVAEEAMLKYFKLVDILKENPDKAYTYKSLKALFALEEMSQRTIHDLVWDKDSLGF